MLSSVNGHNAPTLFPIQVDIQNQRIYWGFGVTEQNKFKATLVCLDFATCNMVWSKPFQDTTFVGDSQIGLAVNGDTVFLTDNNVLWLFSASTGNLAETYMRIICLAPLALGKAHFLASDLTLTAYK